MRSNALNRARAPGSRARLALGAVLLACALGAGTVPAAPPAAPAPTVRVLAAWVRWLPAGLPAAGYLKIENTGDSPISLERASSPDYGEVSIHRSVKHGTEVQMTPVDEITIAPHATLDFESEGYHLMLMQPRASVAAAREIPVNLIFAGGASLTVPLQIRKNPAEGAPAP
jgi:hypothetical protein